MELAGASQALAALEAAGGRGFDADGCDFIGSLLTRAEQLGGAAGELLAARAFSHVQRLDARMQRARAVAERLVSRLEAERFELSEPRAQLERSELPALRRRLRRLAQLPAAAIAPPARPDRIGAVNTYEASASDLLASFAIARARDVVPEQAGPYNPLRIASDLLERIRDVSPIYLTAQLHRLDELGSMLGLPELPPPPSKIQAKKPKRSLKSG